MSYLGADGLWHDEGFYLFQAKMLQCELFNFLIIRDADFFENSEKEKIKKRILDFLETSSIEVCLRTFSDYCFIFRKDWYLRNSAKVKLVLKQTSYSLILILMGVPLPVVAAFDIFQVYKVTLVPWNRSFEIDLF